MAITKTETEKYRPSDSLLRRKLSEYVPVMIITNISLLLINTVDKIIAGNFIGPQAMNSISIFFPVMLINVAFTGLTANGIATSLSNAMGNNDTGSLAHIKTASLRIMVLTAIVFGIIQIPIFWGLIKSYGVSSELSSMIWQYAIGIMICTPLGIVSTVGTLQFQIAGKMKVVMIMTVAEGVLNLLFDLLFVAVMDMGVAGAGYGTACSNLFRCVTTIILLPRLTDFCKGDGKPTTLHDVLSILKKGLPDASFVLMMSFQNYVTLRVILHSFGEDGGEIYGVCAFCLSLVNVFLYAIQGGIRPLMGIFAGAGNRRWLRDLMRQGMLLILILIGITSIIIVLIPGVFFRLHGVTPVPEGGLLAIRLYATLFMIQGFDYLMRIYFTNRKDITFATILTVVGNATLPLFALIMAWLPVPSPCIFLAYTLTELVIFLLSVLRYRHWKSIDQKEVQDDLILYMTIRTEDAVDASQYVRRVAEENGIDRRISFRTAICLEEMVAYIQEAEAFTSLPPEMRELALYMKQAKDVALSLPEDVSVNIILRFVGTGQATLIILDEGAFIALDPDEEKQELITNNYALIKNVAKSVEYQHILNLNYTKITVE